MISVRAVKVYFSETASLRQVEQDLSDVKGAQQSAQAEARDLRERLLTVEQQLKDAEEQRDNLRSQLNAALKDAAGIYSFFLT